MRTEAGDRASNESNDAIWAIEAKLRPEIGAERYDQMKDELRELGRNVHHPA